MKRICTVFLLSILTALAALPVVAQEKGGNDDSLLPEIDPQDIEIRSQFKARFPGLRRQPILGFEPASRIYKVDPDRVPYMESRDNAVASLPISAMWLPESPPFTSMQYSPDINAFARLGAGSYVSPEAQFWGITRPSDKSYVGADFNFSSSDGHQDFNTSSFRFLEANGEFATKLDDRTRLGFDVGFQNSFNHLFSLEQTTASIYNVPNSPRIEYGGFHLGGEVERMKNGAAGWNFEANARYFQTQLMAGDLSGESDEGVYEAAFSKRWTGSQPSETFAVHLGGELGDYSNSLINGQWKTGQAGVEYDRLFNYETHLTADMRVYYGSDDFEDKIYFGPTLKIEQPISEGAVLTAEAGARPYVQTSGQLHSANRFLNTTNTFRHSYKMYGAASLKLKYSEIGSLEGSIRYEDISDRVIFERNRPNGASGEELFYRARYADVTRIRLEAGATHQVVPEKFWINGKAYAQNPKLKEGGRVPFTEKLGFTSGFGLRLFDRATLQGWADYIGERETAAGADMNDYVLLGGQLDISITESIGAYIKGVNLLDHEYQKWEGYTERPLQVYGGITLKL